MGKPIVEPADRRGLRGRRHPAVGDHRRSRARCWPGLPQPTRPGHHRTTSTRCRAARTTTTSSTSSSISRFGPATQRVRPLQPSQGEQLRAAADRGRDQQPGRTPTSKCSTSRSRSASRSTLSSRSLLEVARRRVATEAGKTALGTGDAEHARGLRHHRPADRRGVLRRPHRSRASAAGRPGAVRAAIRSSRIRSSSTRALNYSWMRGTHSLKTGYEYQRINTEVDDVHPKYGARHLRRPVQPAGRRGGRRGDLQPRRLPDGRAQQLRAGQSVRVPAAPADALRLSAGRLARLADADAEPRRSATSSRRRSGKPTTR